MKQDQFNQWLDDNLDRITTTIGTTAYIPKFNRIDEYYDVWGFVLWEGVVDVVRIVCASESHVRTHIDDHGLGDMHIIIDKSTKHADGWYYQQIEVVKVYYLSELDIDAIGVNVVRDEQITHRLFSTAILDLNSSHHDLTPHSGDKNLN